MLSIEKHMIPYIEKDMMNYGTSISPVFKRVGWFLDRKSGETWIELNGKAWLSKNDKKHFDYVIKITGNNRLTPKVYNAIETLLMEGIPLDKRMKSLYMIEKDLKALRKQHIEIGLKILRIRSLINPKLPIK
jgi:hypothetical protein